MGLKWRAALAAALCCTNALASADEGPVEALGGTLLQPAPYAATVVIVPEAARDGPAYSDLASALQERGFGSLVLGASGRFDETAVAASAMGAKTATGSPCIWLLGHGKGGLVALAAAQEASGLCGVILVAAPAKAKSARLAAQLSVPLMIVSGGLDSEIASESGAALRAAQPGARHAVVPEMDHRLRDAAEGGAVAAISPKLVDAIGAFMLEKGPQVQGSLEAKRSHARGSRRAALVRNGAAARS